MPRHIVPPSQLGLLAGFPPGRAGVTLSVWRTDLISFVLGLSVGSQRKSTNTYQIGVHRETPNNFELFVLLRVGWKLLDERSFWPDFGRASLSDLCPRDPSEAARRFGLEWIVVGIKPL